MSYDKWLVHAIMDCLDCDWYCDEFLTAQSEASKHAKDTGHKIHGELGYAVRYNDPPTSGSER